MRRNALLDIIDADLPVAGTQQVGKQVRRAFNCYFAADQAGMGGNPRQCAFKFTDIAGNAVRKEFQHLVGHRYIGAFRLCLKDAQPQLVIGRMDIGHHAPAKAGAQPLFQPLKIGRRLVS